MKVSFKFLVCIALLVASTLLLVFEVLPSLQKITIARGDLKHAEMEAERLACLRFAPPDPAPFAKSKDVPDRPDIAALMAAARRARDIAGAGGLEFVTVESERHTSEETRDGGQEVFDYLCTTVEISYYSPMRNASEFLEEVLREVPGTSVETFRLARRPDGSGRVDASVLLSIYGIPR